MPTYNHPITIRLAPTNIAANTNWISPNPRIGSSLHGDPDGVFDLASISIIPTIMDNIKGFSDPDNKNNTIGSNNDAENLGKSGGGAYITGIANSTFTVAGSANAVVSTSIRDLVNSYMRLARNTSGATTMNLIMHGRNDRSITTGSFDEFSTVISPTQTVGAFDVNFYNTSSFVSFKSSENITTVPKTVGSTTLSFRKGFHHGFIKATQSQIAGMSLTSNIGGLAYITSFGTFDWNKVSGLSANGTCRFNERTTPVQEAATASPPPPGQAVQCSNKQLKFLRVEGNNAIFSNLTATSLFNRTTTNAQVIIGSDPGYLSTTGADVVTTIPYTLATTSSLTIRPQYSASTGSKNYLGAVFAASSVRFFGGTTNIGITPGSYIRISGAATPSNNGIYQVLSLQDGVPGDTNEVITGTTLSPYQYLELSRDITPEESGARIVVENISSLPILHVKYRQTITT